MAYLLGVDTGGTFTDFVLISAKNIRIHKVLSTPEAPEQAILLGIKELGLDDKGTDLRIVHGTTVATNAALESKGVKTAFITNRGFADMLSIGRQARAELYNLTPSISAPPIEKLLCLETGGRVDSKGQTIEPLTDDDLDTLEQQIQALKPDAIAINLLFSFLNDQSEKRIEERLKPYGFITRSSKLLPEIREYERGIVTWYNAYLGPLVEGYLSRLKLAVAPAPVSIMQSSGGTIDIDQASKKAVNLLLSGPAGGLAAGAYIGKLTKTKKILSFDMGGTSTDVAMIDGEIKLTSEAKIGRYPIAIPMVDMHTIGAGGGSIAFHDAAGMLRVGPESSGASPGPACYGKGGNRATVTDANAVLGRLQPDNFLGGRMALDIDSAQASIEKLAIQMSLSIEECAEGIIELANEHMARALRIISEQRGHNPEDYQLMGFGGAGGLHICALAESIGCTKAVVPIYGGVLSALGMLVAPRARNLSRSYPTRMTSLDTELAIEFFDAMKNDATNSLIAEGVSESEIIIQESVDCRYIGQSFTLNIPWCEAKKMSAYFHEEHKQTYGHNFNLDIEIVNLRLSAEVKNELDWFEPKKTFNADYPKAKERQKRMIWTKNDINQLEQAAVDIIQRDELPLSKWFNGPLLICEASSTTWVEQGWKIMSDSYGNLLLERKERQPS